MGMVRYENPDRLVTVVHTAPGLDLSRLPSATGLHLLYGERARSFESSALHARREGTITVGGPPERIWGATVTPSLFGILGVSPELGRTFTEEEGRAGGPSPVILSHGLRQQRFGGDPATLGRTVEIEGTAREVVGVMPEGFAFPTEDTRFWYPLQIDPTETSTFGGFNYDGLGRLAEGITPEAARRELAQLLPEAARCYGNLSVQLLEQGRVAPLVFPYAEDVVGDVRTPLWILLGTVGFVLLIACANVANLSLVRAEGRAREVAVRRAMGAGCPHLAWLFLEREHPAGAGGRRAGGAARLACRGGGPGHPPRWAPQGGCHRPGPERAGRGRRGDHAGRPGLRADPPRPQSGGRSRRSAPRGRPRLHRRARSPAGAEAARGVTGGLRLRPARELGAHGAELPEPARRRSGVLGRERAHVPGIASGEPIPEPRRPRRLPPTAARARRGVAGRRGGGPDVAASAPGRPEHGAPDRPGSPRRTR